MQTKTVAGPFDEKSAMETAQFLGNHNHSIYYNANGEWFVEVHLDILPETICGMTWDQIQAKQQKR